MHCAFKNHRVQHEMKNKVQYFHSVFCVSLFKHVKIWHFPEFTCIADELPDEILLNEQFKRLRDDEIYPGLVPQKVYKSRYFD